MGTFPQYDHPHTLARYGEVADYLGVKGKTDEEKLENLIAAIDALKEQQDALKAEIAENGTGTYRGNNFTLTFSQCERKSTSWAKVAAEIQAPADIVAKYTSASLVNTFKIAALVN